MEKNLTLKCLLLNLMIFLSSGASSEVITTSDLGAIPSVTIKGAIENAIYNRAQDIFDVDQLEFESEYFPVEIIFQNKVLKGELRTRGGIRFCDSFPHFKLKLKKSQSIYDQREFKMLTHGFFPFDPNKKINSKLCRNKFNSSNPEKIYEREYWLYQTAQSLLKYHLKAFRTNVTYQDASANLNLSKLATFIEDIDHAAGRYQMEQYRIPYLNQLYPWTKLNDDSDILEALTADEFMKYLAAEYKRIKAQNSNMSKSDISKKLLRPAEAEKELVEKFQENAKKRVGEFRKTIKDEQMAHLKNIDRNSLVEFLLFNIMIRNGDWALFGLNDHALGLRNAKLLRVNKNSAVIVVPYDFDQSRLASGDEKTIIGKDEYVKQLDQLNEILKNRFAGFLIEDLKKSTHAFAEKISENHSAMLPPNFRTNMKTFSEVLHEYSWKN